MVCQIKNKVRLRWGEIYGHCRRGSSNQGVCKLSKTRQQRVSFVGGVTQARRGGGERWRWRGRC